MDPVNTVLVGLEVVLVVLEVVLEVLVVVLMSRCPFKRLQSAGQIYTPQTQWASKREPQCP